MHMNCLPFLMYKKWEAVHFVGRFFMPFTGVHLERGVCTGKMLKS